MNPSLHMQLYSVVTIAGAQLSEFLSQIVVDESAHGSSTEMLFVRYISTGLTFMIAASPGFEGGSVVLVSLVFLALQGFALVPSDVRSALYAFLHMQI